MIDHTDTITPDMFPPADTVKTHDLVLELQKRFDELVDSTGRSRQYEFQQAYARFAEACMWLRAGLENKG